MDPARIREVFSLMDPSHRGYIDLTEEKAIENVRAAMESMGIPFQQHTIKDFLRGIDHNHDGHVSYNEFHSFILLRQDALRKAFDQLDIGGDGKIGFKDLRLACHRLDIHLSDEQIRRLIHAADENNTGHVEFSEFCEMLITAGEVNIGGLFQQWLDHSTLDDGDISTLPQAEDTEVPGWVTLVAGGTAGVFSRTLTAPMDRLKIILQAQTRHPLSSSPQSSSIREVVREILAEGGWRGFFRGNGVNVLKIAPETAVKFWAYETLKTYVCTDLNNPSLAERFTAGALAGAVSQLCIYPLEISKARIALSKRGEYKGIADCLRKTVHFEGWRALYRGSSASVMGIIPYSGVDLTVYFWLKDWYAARYPDDKPGVLTLLTCGATATTCGQIVAYPLQLIRTRLQAQGMKGRPIMYDGILDCFKKTLQADGPRGLYRGILPNFMKSLPAISISYAVYETGRSVLMDTFC